MRLYILITSLLLTQLGFSQVGIGTKTPTPGYELDVNGSLLIQKNFKFNTISSNGTQLSNVEFLFRLLNSQPVGEVSRLDLKESSVGPINIINYTFTNFPLDNVQDVDLQFDASKYIVGLSNFRYEGDPIVKGGTGYLDIGNFVTRTFIENGTWHLEMRNRSRDASTSNEITYHVTLIVYDRKYFKELPKITVNFGGGTNATTSKPAGL